jgi:hypothetical protein
MRISRQYDIRDDVLGTNIIEGLDVVMDCSLEYEDGEPVVAVNAVYVNGKNLDNGLPMSRMMSSLVAEMAEDDDSVLDELIEDEIRPTLRRTSSVAWA